jgi:hypothetical protein
MVISRFKATDDLLQRAVAECSPLHIYIDRTYKIALCLLLSLIGLSLLALRWPEQRKPSMLLIAAVIFPAVILALRWIERRDQSSDDESKPEIEYTFGEGGFVVMVRGSEKKVSWGEVSFYAETKGFVFIHLPDRQPEIVPKMSFPKSTDQQVLLDLLSSKVHRGNPIFTELSWKRPLLWFLLILGVTVFLVHRARLFQF